MWDRRKTILQIEGDMSMEIKYFFDGIRSIGIDHFLGIPDSTLKLFCEYLNGELKEEISHYVPSNEGAAVGMAAGIYLATGKPTCVYLQNSGLGNIYNPVVSLAHKEVYNIPILFIVGWRGMPGEKDEPQHVFQGKITEETLSLLGVTAYILSKETADAEFEKILKNIKEHLDKKERCALIIRKGTFRGESTYKPKPVYSLSREAAIRCILTKTDIESAIISTTGKISRELYEAQKEQPDRSGQSFFTVGSMGHASMIALGVAVEQPWRTVYCLDGDGAAFMHMGAMAFIGHCMPHNYIHILLNNDTHESVGGMPTGISGTDYSKIAEACGYKNVYVVDSEEALSRLIIETKKLNGPTFIEIKTAVGSRTDLGRPKEMPIENERRFMEHLNLKPISQ